MKTRQGLTLFLLILCLSLVPSQAQESSNPIQLKLSLPSHLKEVWGMAGIFDDFEASHPNLEIVLLDYEEKLDLAFISLEDYLDQSQQMASSADIVFVSSGSYSIYDTLAGNFLDIAPLLNTSQNISPEIFRQPLLKSFGWTNGIWALPLDAYFIGISYDPEMFDNLNITHPTENWTVDDFYNILLAFEEANQLPAFRLDLRSDVPFLLYTMGGPFYQLNEQGIEEPDFALSPASDAFQQFLDYEQRNIIIYPNFGEVSSDDYLLPLSIDYVSNPLNSEIVPFPNGKYMIEATGLALSAGTDNPQLAYEFLEYIVSHPLVSNSYVGDVSSLRNLEEINDEDRIVIQNPPSELVNHIVESMDELITPSSELLYWDYVFAAYVNATGTENVLPSLDAQWSRAQNDLNYLLEHQSNTTVAVESTNNSSENTLQLGIVTPTEPINEALWLSSLENFALEEDSVEQAILTEYPSVDMIDLSETDCFIAPYNALSAFPAEAILDIAPLLNTDAFVDQNDFLSGGIETYSINNSIYAFPMFIYPYVLQVNPQLLEASGISNLDSLSLGALLTSYALQDETGTLIYLNSGNASAILSIAAVNMDAPVSFQNSFGQVDFSNPETIEALKAFVLALDAGTVSGTAFAANDDPQSGILSGFYVGGNDLIPYLGIYPFDESKEYTLMPAGLSIPMTYRTGAGYISASSEYREACYSLLRQLSEQPLLYNAMPARRSVFDNTPASYFSDSEYSLYQDYLAQLDNPQAIVLPENMLSYWESIWLNSLLNASDYGTFEAQLQLSLPSLEAFYACLGDAGQFHLNPLTQECSSAFAN